MSSFRRGQNLEAYNQFDDGIRLLRDALALRPSITSSRLLEDILAALRPMEGVLIVPRWREARIAGLPWGTATTDTARKLRGRQDDVTKREAHDLPPGKYKNKAMSEALDPFDMVTIDLLDRLTLYAALSGRKNEPASRELILAAIEKYLEARDSSKGHSRASKGGRPRKPVSRADRRIFEAWETKRYRSHKQLAEDLDMSPAHVTRVIRMLKRRERRTSTPPR